MLQCFVRPADLDKLYAAEEKVFAAAAVTSIELEAFTAQSIFRLRNWTNL